jgi:shikimate dehydrogenase
MTTADAMPIDIDQLDPGTAVVDLVLKPVNPPLLKAAQEMGCQTANGNTVLAAQVDLIADFFLIARG